MQGERRSKTYFDYAEPQPTLDLSNPQNEEIGEISCNRGQSSNSFETLPSAADIAGTEMGISIPTLPNVVFENLPDLLK